MSMYPSNPARPPDSPRSALEGAPPGVSYPPGVSWAPSGTAAAVARPPGGSGAPAPVPAWIPPPQPVVATGQRRLLLAIVAMVLLVAALGFFFIFLLLLAPRTPTPAATSAQTLAVAATAVARQDWLAAEGGCVGLLKNPPTDAASQRLLAQTYYACGLYLVQPGKSDVLTARQYFLKADQLLPADTQIVHQRDLANRYNNAYQTVLKPDLGGYIDQLEWFTQQPEFAEKPYADVPQLLYRAYLDSGRGYLQVHVCNQARHRFDQATKLKFVDANEAWQLLNLTDKTCK